MPERSKTALVAWVAVAMVALGVLATWTIDESVRLDGLDGPNNGWLVLIVAALALGWIRSMSRGSWFGVVGVLGASVVIGWTALSDLLTSRSLGEDAGYGLLLVIGASLALAGAAVVRGVELRRAKSHERASAA